MDKQDIQHYLYEIAEEEIPDVDLLPEIQKQLKKQSPPSTRMVFTLARAATVFVLLLTVSAVLGYAYYQNIHIPATIPRDLITELNMEQTIDDMTVTLDWAYADAHHMALEISSTYDARVTARGNSQEVRLETSDGIFIPPAFGGGGGGSGGGNSNGAPIIISSSFMSSYDMTVIDSTSDTVDFVLTVRYSYQETPSMPSDTGGGSGGGSGSSGSGGGSGSTGSGNGSGASRPDIVPDSEAPFREFVFEFSLPVLAARPGDVAEASITGGENTVTIQNVSVTPSMTVFELCSSLLAEGWLPQAILQTNQSLPDYLEGVPIATTLDGTVVYPAYAYTLPEDADCLDLTVPAPFSIDAGELTIIVDQFSRYVDGEIIETLEADMDYFAELGFAVSYEIVDPPVIISSPSQITIPISTGEMVIFTIESYPDTITQSVANSYVGSNALQERITGDWVFTVTVE